MSVAYVDSSCIAAIVLGEPGHERLEARLRRFEILLSHGLLEAEVCAALEREGLEWSGPESFRTVIDWVHPHRPLSQEIWQALSVGLLRGADLWHVACALYARVSTATEIEFLTLDERQRAIAAELGFDTSAVT